LPNENNRLDRANVSGRIFQNDVAIIEIVRQRLFDQLVVAMVFALVLERPLPRLQTADAGQF
jgi:hypothetical protein